MRAPAAGTCLRSFQEEKPRRVCKGPLILGIRGQHLPAGLLLTRVATVSVTVITAVVVPIEHPRPRALPVGAPPPLVQVLANVGNDIYRCTPAFCRPAIESSLLRRRSRPGRSIVTFWPAGKFPRVLDGSSHCRTWRLRYHSVNRSHGLAMRALQRCRRNLHTVRRGCRGAKNRPSQFDPTQPKPETQPLR